MENTAAYCAHHGQAPAVLTCTRCGDFVCQECVAGPSAPGLCVPCLGRTVAGTRMDLKDAFDVPLLFGAGWRAVKGNALPLWVGGAAMSCTDGNCSGSGGDVAELFTSQGGESSLLSRSLGATRLTTQDFGLPTSGWMVFAGIAVVALAIFMIGLYAWLRPGFLRMTVYALRGETQAGVLFSGGDRMLAILGWTLLKSAIYLAPWIPAGAAVGMLVWWLGVDSVVPWVVLGILFIPYLVAAVYVTAGLSLGDYLIALENASVMDAARASWQRTHGRRWWLVLISIVVALVEVAGFVIGLMLLCIGWLVTVPLARSLAECMFTAGYLRSVEGPGALPSPPAYGGPPGPVDGGPAYAPPQE